MGGSRPPVVSGEGFDLQRLPSLKLRRVGGRIQAGERGLARGQLRDGGDHKSYDGIEGAA